MDTQKPKAGITAPNAGTTKKAKGESIVSRLFGFGKKKDPVVEHAVDATPDVVSPENGGFARTSDSPESGEATADAAAAAALEAVVGESDSDDTRIRIPEQVIRVKPSRVKAADAVASINESFQELTSLLGHVGDRLDRQDDRASDLAEQIKDLPEYLRKLPQIAEDQNRALENIGDRLAEGTEITRRMAEGQARANEALGSQVARTTDSMESIAGAMTRIPDELRESTQAQAETLREVASHHEAAIRKVAAAQQQQSKVIHHTHQKSLHVFHEATQKSLAEVQRGAKTHKRQMEEVLEASISNMKRMFLLSGAFMIAALAALVALLLLR